MSQLTVAFDAMIQFVEDDSQRYKMAEEMEQRGVKSLTFFDVVLDFILMDSFEDITDPPPTVLAVIGNRWLSYGVKERVRIRPSQGLFNMGIPHITHIKLLWGKKN